MPRDIQKPLKVCMLLVFAWLLKPYYECFVRGDVRLWLTTSKGMTLRWRQPQTWGYRDMEILSTLLALGEGNTPVTGGFPSPRASNGESVSKLSAVKQVDELVKYHTAIKSFKAFAKSGNMCNNVSNNISSIAYVMCWLWWTRNKVYFPYKNVMKNSKGEFTKFSETAAGSLSSLPVRCPSGFQSVSIAVTVFLGSIREWVVLTDTSQQTASHLLIIDDLCEHHGCVNGIIN